MKILFVVLWTVVAFVSRPCHHIYPGDKYGVPRNYEYADFCGEYVVTPHEQVFESSETAKAFMDEARGFSEIQDMRMVVREKKP